MVTHPDQDSLFVEYKIPMGNQPDCPLMFYTNDQFQLPEYLTGKWPVYLNTFVALFLALHSKILEIREKKKPPYPKCLLQSSTQISIVVLRRRREQISKHHVNMVP